MIEKILSFLNNIPDDKVRHAYMGAALFCILALFIPLVYSVVFLSIVALGKEVYDYLHPNHTCDVWDFVATVGGAVPAILLGVFR